MTELESISAQQRRRAWLTVGAFGAMIVYLVMSHAHPQAAFIGCPFHALTGYSCFGCGMTRSTAHFIHGDLRAAIGFHPFGPLFVIAFGSVAAHNAAQLIAGRQLDYALLRIWRKIEKPIWVGTALVLGIFGVTRFVLEVTGFLTPI